MGYLSNLLMCASAEEDLRNTSFAIFILRAIFGRGTRAKEAGLGVLEKETKSYYVISC